MREREAMSARRKSMLWKLAPIVAAVLLLVLPACGGDAPDTDGDGFLDGFEVENGFDPLVAEDPATTDHDGDGLTDAEEVALGTDPANKYDPVYVDDDGPGDIGEHGNPDMSNPDEDGSFSNRFDSIQEAIEDARTGDIIKLEKGTYTGKGNYNIDFMGKKITVRAADYADTPDTIIECPKESFAFIFQSRETNKSILSGITITSIGGAEPNDPNNVNCLGGINCLGNTSPLIKDCVFKGWVTAVYAKGEQNDNTTCSPIISGCWFSNSPKKTAKHAVWLEDCTVWLDDCSIQYLSCLYRLSLSALL